MGESQISNLKSQIFLVGFMASGKSTVGPVLAAKLNRAFIDLDPLIEARAGCTVAELFASEGEERFREIEMETLRQVTLGEPAAIAPGGGAIKRSENRELMAQRGITIWLDAPFELCWRRIQRDGTVRPLAAKLEEARERYENRLQYYRQAAIHIAIDDSQTPDEIAEAIISEMRASPKCGRRMINDLCSRM